MNPRLKFIGLVIVGLVFLSLGLKFLNLRDQAANRKPCLKKTLVVWSPLRHRELETLKSDLKSYCLTIKDKQKEIPQIESELINALASDSGPAVALVSLDFLREHKDLLAAPPTKLKLNFTADDFPTSLQSIFSPTIMGYPFTYDTLFLFWNRDLLSSTFGLSVPPKTQEDLLDLVSSYVASNKDNQTARTIALGAGNNIPAATEIFLSFLAMVEPNYTQSPNQIGRGIIRTLDQYTRFANPDKPFTGWSQTLPNARQAFINEQVMMMIDFGQFEKEIKKQNSRLSYGLAPFPRLASQPKRANYLQPYVFIVTKGHEQTGWIFLNLLHKQHQKITQQANLRPVSLMAGERARGPERVAFEELLVGQTFSKINKPFMRQVLPSNIDNWLTNRRDIEQLILYRQTYQFLKRSKD